MLTRRQTLAGALLLPSLPLLGKLDEAKRDVLRSSRLIYLTPIKSDGNESACKGEVWFMYDGDSHLHVVTQNEAWRANAIRQGLTQARIWVGEFGVWSTAGDAYRAAPELMLDGTIEMDEQVHNRVLAEMGTKYSDEWGVWGPRFRDGLQDGSRVMLKYAIGAK